MRKINDKNQIWFEEGDDGVRIGFTQSFLDTLDQCWHILPSNTEKFKLKAPLLTVETNDALISIMSPVAGNFMHYSDKAQNFPDRLVEADIIMQLSHKNKVVQPQAVAQEAPQRWIPPANVQEFARGLELNNVRNNDQGFRLQGDAIARRRLDLEAHRVMLDEAVAPRNQPGNF